MGSMNKYKVAAQFRKLVFYVDAQNEAQAEKIATAKVNDYLTKQYPEYVLILTKK
jgi:hypothetical protein